MDISVGSFNYIFLCAMFFGGAVVSSQYPREY